MTLPKLPHFINFVKVVSKLAVTKCLQELSICLHHILSRLHARGGCFTWHGVLIEDWPCFSRCKKVYTSIRQHDLQQRHCFHGFKFTVVSLLCHRRDVRGLGVGTSKTESGEGSQPAANHGHGGDVSARNARADSKYTRESLCRLRQ